MTQQVYVGTNAAPQTGLYGGSSPIDYEEQSTGSNGFGVRMTASRVYTNWYTQPFTGGSRELAEFNSGHLIVISVSNMYKSPGPVGTQTVGGVGVGNFTHRKLAAGTYQTVVDAMWTRVAALAFDTAVAGGSTYGGFTQPAIEFIDNHEQNATGVDGVKGKLYYDNGYVKGSLINGTKDTAADYQAGLIYLYQRWVLAAGTAGVPVSRVRFNFDMTSTGFRTNVVAQYWPAALPGMISTIGSDPYLNSGDGIFDARPFAISKGLPLSFPEFNYAAADSTTRANAFTATATALANDTTCTYRFLCVWNAADSNNNGNYNFNKVAGASAAGHAFPLTHAAMATMIATLGSNPIIASVGQADPTAPTVNTPTSNAAGTNIGISWANPPVGDHDTGWNVYLALGTTTILTKINTSPLSAGTRAYTYTALANGTPIAAGGTYSLKVEALNAGPVGAASSIIQTITTTKPGPTSSAPIITVQTALPDNVTPGQIDITVAATSPISSPLTYAHTVTGPNGFIQEFAGTTGTVIGPNGAYVDSVLVSDAAGNTTPASIPFNIAVSLPPTPNVNLVQPPPGIQYPDLPPLIRGNQINIDNVFGGLLARQSAHNAKYNLSGSNFSPDDLSGSTTLTPNASFIYWAGFILEDTQLTQLLLATLTTAQTGTGVTVSVHDASGAMLPDFNGTPASGSAVDGAFQGTPGPIVVPLGLQITGRTFGELLFAQICWPASGVTAYSPLRVGTVAGGMAKIGAGATTPLWGSAAFGTIQDPIPFASWTSQNQVWVGAQ